MLPNILEIQIRSVRKALDQNIDGQLPLYERIKIWKLFGEYIDRDDESLKLNPPFYMHGHKRRLMLQKMCVEKVVSIWEQKMGVGTIVHEILNVILRYLNRGYPPIPPPSGLTALEETSTLVIENYQDGDNLVFIPCACSALLSISISDQNDWTEPEADNMTDHLSPFGCHPDYYASQFFINDLSELKNYWYWYLDTAVPSAFKSAKG